VADVPSAVADTHALVYFAGQDKRLGRRAAAHLAACDAGQAMVYVPVATILECTLLTRSGKIDLHRSVRSFFVDLFSNEAFQPYDLTQSQVFLAEEARFNRDPFDALICAAAMDLELPLLTRDADIVASGLVRVIW